MASKERIAEIKKAIIDEIAERDRLAKTASMGFRQLMQTGIQKSHGEWRSGSGDPPEMANYFSPQIGLRVDKMVAAEMEMIFTDPEEYGNFTVAAKWKGLALKPDVDVNLLIQSRQRVRLKEIALGQAVQDAMREMGFMQMCKRLVRDTHVAGSCYATIDCDDITAAGASGIPIFGKGTTTLTDDAEANVVEMAPPDPFGMDEYAPPATTTSNVIHRYACRRIDPRNFFPGSIQQDEGIHKLEWWTTYCVFTWHELAARAAVFDEETQTWSGRYFGLDELSEIQPNWINRIFYDDIQYSEAYSWNDSSMPYGTQLERGWRGFTYSGVFGPGDVGERLGGDPTDSEWDAVLKDMGNDTTTIANRRNIRWWDIAGAYASPSTYPSSAVLIQMQPHDLFDGKRCPYVMGRHAIFPGRFFGKSVYGYIGGDEEIWNIGARSVTYQSILAAMPPGYYAKHLIDKKYLAENQDSIRLGPKCLIPLRPEAQFSNMKPIELFVPAPESFAAASQNMQMCITNMDQRTGQGDIQFGQAAQDVTATTTAAAQQNAFTITKDFAVNLEADVVAPLANMILAAILHNAKIGGLQYHIDSYEEAQGLSGMHPGVDAILNGVPDEMAQNVFPVHIPIPGEELGDMEFEVMVNSASGGRAAQIAAMNQFYVRSEAQNVTTGTSQWNLMDLSMDIGRLEGARDLEKYRVTPEMAAREQALKQQQMMEQAALAGGAGSEAAPMGEASQPAEPGGMDPAEAAQGGQF